MSTPVTTPGRDTTSGRAASASPAATANSTSALGPTRLAESRLMGAVRAPYATLEPGNRSITDSEREQWTEGWLAVMPWLLLRIDPGRRKATEW